MDKLNAEDQREDTNKALEKTNDKLIGLSRSEWVNWPSSQSVLNQNLRNLSMESAKTLKR